MLFIEAREKGTEGARAEAARLEADARRIRAEVDERLKAARAEASKERDALRLAGSKQESEVLATVRGEVTAMVEAERKALDNTRVELRREVLAAVPALATEIARKALRQEVAS